MGCSMPSSIATYVPIARADDDGMVAVCAGSTGVSTIYREHERFA